MNTTNGNILRLEWGLCDGLVIIVEDEEVGGQSPPQGGVHVHTGVLLLHASVLYNVYIGNPASKGPQYSTVLTYTTPSPPSKLGANGTPFIS